MISYQQILQFVPQLHQNHYYLVLAVSVGVTTLVTTLVAMGKFRRTIRAIFGGSSTRSPKYQLIRTEIIESEERHVDCLEFIQKVYYEPLEREAVLTPDQLWDVFCNSRQVLEVHRNILKTLKNSKQSFEKTIYGVFSGKLGADMEQEVALFCSRHKLKGLTTWIKLKNEDRVRQLINPEAIMEANPESPLAKLSLDDHLSAIFQRPLRYPLLLDRLTEECSPNSGEGRYLAKTLARSREIGFNINEQVRRAERLFEIDQKTTRASGLPELNLLDQKLIREDRLTWRISKTKSVDVLLVLTDTIAVILRRESNGRFTYKLQKIPDNPKKSVHNPLVRLTDDLITKNVATDTNAFFLMSSEQDVLYEFVAPTLNERNLWMEDIGKAAANAKKARNTDPPNKRMTFRPPADQKTGSDTVDEDQVRQVAQEFKRESAARKSWFDSLSKRKSKGLAANRDKRKSSVLKEEQIVAAKEEKAA